MIVVDSAEGHADAPPISRPLATAHSPTGRIICSEPVGERKHKAAEYRVGLFSQLSFTDNNKNHHASLNQIGQSKNLSWLEAAYLKKMVHLSPYTEFCPTDF